MRSWTGIPEINQSYRILGAAKFWAVMLGLASWLGLGVWLMETVSGWPEAYGSTCRRKCFFEDLWYSPGLLNGGWHEWALFAYFWSMPAVIAGTLIYAFMTKRGIFKKN